MVISPRAILLVSSWPQGYSPVEFLVGLIVGLSVLALLIYIAWLVFHDT